MMIVEENVLIVSIEFWKTLASDVAALANGVHGVARRRVSCETSPSQLSNGQVIGRTCLALTVPIV